MRRGMTVKDLLTEVGTLVGMYDSEYRITPTKPSSEQVYCRELADNGHTKDSLTDRWVVLRDTAGIWRQRKIADYSSSSDILAFYHASNASLLFQHEQAILYLFDLAPPQIVLRTIIPELSTQSHLAQLQGMKTIDMAALNARYAIDPSNADTAYDARIEDKAGYRTRVGISGISQVLSVRVAGQVLPVDYWKWEYFGNGDFGYNGELTLDNAYERSKVQIIYSDNPQPADFDITDWEEEIADLEPRAGESLKYSCAARWMSATLPSMDEEGWNYAKRTETHFRNRAQATDIVLPATLR